MRFFTRLGQLFHGRGGPETRAARQRIDRLSLILANLPQGVLTLDSEGLISGFSGGAERLWQTTVAEVMGTPVQDLFSPFWAGRIRPAMATGVESVAEAMRRDGSLFPIVFSAVRATAGDPLGDPLWVMTVRDATDQKQVEETWRRRQYDIEGRYRNLVEAERLSDMGHYEITRSKPQAQWSLGMMRLWGMPRIYTATSLLQCLDEIHPDDRARMRMLLGDPGWSAITAEFRLQRPDGEVRHLHFRGYRDLDTDGSIIREFGVLQDISEHRRAEDDLRTAKQKAEAIIQSHYEMLATTSHEIRTPMNGILGVVQILLDTELTPEQRSYLETIQFSGSALLTVVNDLLELSRAEERQVALAMTALDLRGLTRTVVDLMAPRASAKGLTLMSSVAPDLPEAVIGDGARLRQVLLNLVGNAIKFTERGVVSMHVEMGEPVESQGIGFPQEPRVDIRFTIRDTGIGISPAVREKLFFRYEQGDPSVSHRFGGTGLGLAISRQIVTAMGGTIVIADNVVDGVGSVFVVSVPLPVLSRAGAAPANRTSEERERLTPFSILPRRILVVEDVEVNRRVAIALLERDGHRVEVAETGTQGLDMAEANDYDLILMDIRLPDLEGTEVTRRIRGFSDPVRASVPIIALTANVFPDDIKAYRAIGMDAVVAKPIQIEQMRAAIAQITDELDSPFEDDVKETTPPQAPLFDRTMALDRLRSLGQETFLNILALGRAGVETAAIEVTASADEGNFPHLAVAAHKLAGAASNFGFSALVEQGRRIERLVEGGDTQEAYRLALSVRNMVDETLMMVDAWTAEMLLTPSARPAETEGQGR